MRYAKSWRRHRKSRSEHITSSSALNPLSIFHIGITYTTYEFGVPAKLIRLGEITLKNAQMCRKVGNNLAEPFDADDVDIIGRSDPEI